MQTAKAIIQENNNKLSKSDQVHVLKWTLKQYQNGNVITCSTMTKNRRYKTFIKAKGQAYCSCPAFQYKKDAKACKHLIALAMVIENKKKSTGF